MSVVEIDYSGCRKRSLSAVVRHYAKVEILRLPVCDHDAKRVAQHAVSCLGQEMEYAHSLVRFGFAWANFRSLDHPHIKYWARALFPFAAVIAWFLGRGKVTCSGFVQRVLVETGVSWHLPMQFDRTLPYSDVDRNRRPHGGIFPELCSPGDIWCALASPVPEGLLR